MWVMTSRQGRLNSAFFAKQFNTEGGAFRQKLTSRDAELLKSEAMLKC